MAIKLKSNKKLVYLLLLVLFCALVMSGNSASVGEYQIQLQGTNEENESDVYAVWPSADGGPEENLKSFVRFMYAGSYMMYWELRQKESGTAMEPAELFFPESIQVTKRTELENFNEEFAAWGKEFTSLLEQYRVVYRIVDTQSETVYTNAAENLELYAKDLEQDAGNLEKTEEIPFFLELNFDEEGSVSIENMQNADGIVLNAGEIPWMTKERVQQWFIRDEQLPTALLASPEQVKVYLYSNNENCYYPQDSETPEQTGSVLPYSEVCSQLRAAYYTLLVLMTAALLWLPAFRRLRREWAVSMGRIPLEGIVAGGLLGGLGQPLGAAFSTLYLRSGYSAGMMVLNFLAYFGLYGIWSLAALVFLQLCGQSGDSLRERSWIWKNMARIHSFSRRMWKKLRNLLQTVDIHDASDRWLAGIVGAQLVLLLIGTGPGPIRIVLLLVYSFCLFFVLKKRLTEIRESYDRLLQAAHSMAGGNLKAEPPEDLGVFASLGKELVQIQDGFSQAVEEELRSRNLKTELITNVSHDLKTPLTAIITYVNLLKDPAITEEERRSYVEILDRKSLRLKKLIEDLFEISKAASGNIRMEYNWVDIGELLQQAVLEQEDRLRERGIVCRVSVPEERLRLRLDGEKTYRILENLLVNAAKYAMPDTRAWASLKKQGTEVQVVIKNTSATELEGDCNELTERFVRGDRARNTEGSGLGLAIVKSFTELQGGRFRIETDGDLFKAIVTFPYDPDAAAVPYADEKAHGEAEPYVDEKAHDETESHGDEKAHDEAEPHVDEGAHVGVWAEADKETYAVAGEKAAMEAHAETVADAAEKMPPKTDPDADGRKTPESGKEADSGKAPQA